MSYGIVVMKILILSLYSAVFLATNAEVYYVPIITDNVFSCDNFENKFLDCDELKVGSSKGAIGDDSATLSGQIKTSLVLQPDFDIEIDVWKVLDLCEEYMYTSRMNFCQSLEKEDTPWYPVIQKMNISGCPVPARVFEVQGLTISLDALKDVMTHNFCGAYRVQLSFMDGVEKMSCHVIELSIVEQDDEDEDEEK